MRNRTFFIINLLLILTIFKANAQFNLMNNAPIKIITSKEGIEYLESNNKTLKDFSDLRIPSGYGTVYELDNGEIILVHTIGEGEYPGFIFNSLKEFKESCDNDFFPIPKENMTWLEQHAIEMQDFLKEHQFYTAALNTELKITAPFKSISECEDAYDKLTKYLKNNKKPVELRSNLIHSYAIAMAKFLIEEKGYNWELKKTYEIYNPYYYPVIIYQNTKSNVVSNAFIALGDRNKAEFRFFYWMLSGIPMNIDID
ncbi:MAG TPA: hypothetical protein DCO90_10460 [Sphingobacterium sp.]|nr:hypothetical protein [Sphingobacterium sp.]